MRRKLWLLLGFVLALISFSAIFFVDWHVPSTQKRLLQIAKTLPKATDLHYWKVTRERPQRYVHPRPSTERYLCWHSWGAGFNNERISLELTVTLALVWNRTLVLPPSRRHYNLKQFSYEDFWEIDDIKQIVPVLTYDEFRQIEPSIGSNYEGIKKISKVLEWIDIYKFTGIFVHPYIPDRQREPEIWNRMAKFATQKRMGILRSYSTEPGLADARIVYFPGHYLFAPFFAYVFVHDAEFDRYIRRSVRDYVHLKTEIFDAANLIVDALPPKYTALHIRRGDFQYQSQRHLTGQQIYENVKDLLPPGSAVYIATDENDQKVFDSEFRKVFEDHGHKVHLMRDYIHLIEDKVPSNWIGPIEQVVCSRATIFVGTKLSTFTGYINRLRGYMPDIEDKNIYFTDTKYPAGYSNLRIFPKEWPTWNDYWINFAMWGMEYKESWTDLD